MKYTIREDFFAFLFKKKKKKQCWCLVADFIIKFAQQRLHGRLCRQLIDGVINYN